MDSFSYPQIMLRLQITRKAQKISYAALGERLGVPESTIKKWFSAKDGAYSRILVLTQALNTSIEDIFRELQQQQVSTFVMGEKQQKSFLQDPTLFAVYWLLVYERKTSEEIRDQLQLTPAELRRHFLKLDRLRLIDFNTKEKASAPKVIPVRWSNEGPFLEKLFREWAHSLLNERLRAKDLILQYFQISAEAELELRSDLLKLEEKYARQTYRELNLKKKNLKQLRLLVALGSGSFMPSREACLEAPLSGRISS